MLRWLFIYVFISQCGFKKRLWIPQKVVVERMEEHGGEKRQFYLKCGFWRLGFLMIRFLWFI